MAILKYKDKDGNFVVLPTGGGSSAPPIAEDVSYDNSSSGLKAEDTQAAIDELSENVINYSIDETGTGLTIDGGFITQLTTNNNCILINKTTSKASSIENLKDENNNIYNFNDFDFLILTMHSSYDGSGGSWEMEPALITPEFFQMKKNIGLSYNNGTSRSVIVSYIDDTHIGFIDTYTGFEEFYVYGIILKNKTFGINKKQHHYSTEEQVVGTWVDGKPLYEKTIELSQTISKQATDIPLGIDSTIMNIIDYDIICKYDTSIVKTGFITYDNTYMFGTLIDKNNLIFRCNSNIVGRTYNFTIILKYTKTTD